MKQGKSLSDLVATVEEQARAKRDFLAPSTKLSLTHTDQDQFTLHLTNGNGGYTYTPTPLCHEQMASRLDIPLKYYRRLTTEAPDLLTHNVNHWFQTKTQPFLIRTLGEHARALLSNKYRPLDNFDLLRAILPIVTEDPDTYQVHSCEITDTRLYLKIISPKTQEAITLNDIVQAGICISNSEVGLGSISIEPFIYRLACLNGMILQDATLKRRHVGRSFTNHEFEDAYEYFSDETKALDDKAFFLKVRDVTKAAFNEVHFRQSVERLRTTTTHAITKDPQEVVDITRKHYGLSESEHFHVLTNLLMNADLSQYGLAQAITQTAQDVPSYDRATELERLGGQIIELPQKEWHSLAA